jgi:hypothetical protein
LAGNERGAQDTDEEAKDDESGRGRDETSQGSRDGAGKQTASKDETGSEAITQRTSDEADDERASETHNVGVGELVLAHVEILLDGEGQERGERIP